MPVSRDSDRLCEPRRTQAALGARCGCQGTRHRVAQDALKLGPTYLHARVGSVAPMPRLSWADLRHAGSSWFGQHQYSRELRGHRQEFVTVPDTAGMWWLVPILGVAS